MMRNVFMGAALLGSVTVAAFGGAAQTQTGQDQDRFTAALSKSVLPAQPSGTALSAAGGAWLTENAKTADLLLIGEMHGVADIAAAATALAHAQNATVYAAEVGHAAAWKLNAMLKAKDSAFERYMADARRANSFAFLNMREEAAFARSVLQNSSDAEMWGLDQEFITSGPLLLERLGTQARTAAEKEAVAAARRGLGDRFFSLSKVPAQLFADLKAAFAQNPPALALIGDMELSAQIYDALGYAQNAPREDLMKREFLKHWRRVNGAPKIVMKMGSNHLQAGLSTTMVPAFGGFVRNLALIENKTVFSVLILCGPGGTQRAFDASTEKCDGEFEGLASALTPHLLKDSATVFKTAPLRQIAGTLKRLGLGEDLRQLIFSYDAILVLKDAKPAEHFAAPDPKWFETP